MLACLGLRQSQMNEWRIAKYDYVNIIYVLLNGCFSLNQNWGSSFSCVDIKPSAVVPTSGTSENYLHSQRIV